jgi:hypothetical protein
MQLEKQLAVWNGRGWRVATALLRRWMRGPVRFGGDLPGAPASISLEWALHFQRARAAFFYPLESPIWEEPRFRAEWHRYLFRNGYLRNERVAFGDLAAPQPALDRDQLHFLRPAGSELDPDDELKAALGEFTAHVIPVGYVQPHVDGYQVVIERLGLYLRDRYEPSGGAYDEWRRHTGRGHDFWVFSETQVVELEKPGELVLPIEGPQMVM